MTDCIDERETTPDQGTEDPLPQRDTVLRAKHKYLEKGIFVIAMNLDLWAFALDKLVAGGVLNRNQMRELQDTKLKT